MGSGPSNENPIHVALFIILATTSVLFFKFLAGG